VWLVGAGELQVGGQIDPVSLGSASFRHSPTPLSGLDLRMERVDRAIQPEHEH
jgi:hypothetical protein